MDGLKVYMVKKLLYADDMVVFAITPEELQHGLDLYKIWKLVYLLLAINVSKTKKFPFSLKSPC